MRMGCLIKNGITLREGRGKTYFKNNMPREALAWI